MTSGRASLSWFQRRQAPADPAPQVIWPSRWPWPSRLRVGLLRRYRAGLRSLGRHMPVPVIRQRARTAELEYRVGCALYTLALRTPDLSEAIVPELMELSGADLQTVFRVLDRLSPALLQNR